MSSEVAKLLADDKYEEAGRLATSKLDTFRTSGDNAGIATMLLASAEVALAKGEAAKALKDAREAWPVAKGEKDKKLVAKILLAMVDGLIMQGSVKEALKAANSSMQLMKDAQDELLVAGLHHAMATAHLQLNDPEDAIEAEQKALQIYKKLKDTQGEAGSLSNTAKAQCLIGRFDEAISTATEACAMWQGMKKGAGVAACVETLSKVQAAQGFPQKAMATAEEELKKLQKAGCNIRNKLIMMEKVAQVASDQGLKLESLRIMEDMITACKDSNDPLAEAQKSMRVAEVHVENNHSQDALRLAKQAQKLFEGLEMRDDAEEAKKLQTSILVKKGDYDNAPHREDALSTLKSFILAVEQRDVEKIRQFEPELEKFSSAIQDSEMSDFLESLFGRDPAALGFLEQQGWDLKSFKVPTSVYAYPQKAFYLTKLASGWMHGPQFRAVNPYRKGKADADPQCLAVCQLPETEAWQGQMQFRPGLMDAALQSQSCFGFPPF